MGVGTGVWPAVGSKAMGVGNGDPVHAARETSVMAANLNMRFLYEVINCPYGIRPHEPRGQFMWKIFVTAHSFTLQPWGCI